MWTVQALEIANDLGRATGRWRLTACSDEDGGGPFGDTSHDHGTSAEAEACDRCDAYVSSVTGFPTRKDATLQSETRDRVTYERLKAKFEGDS